jgi:predicted O-methyltransferase YrrM
VNSNQGGTHTEKTMTTEPHFGRVQILEMMGGFRPACVLGAAAELDVFTMLGDEAVSGQQLASRLGSDLRATCTLLDALAALRLLEKQDNRYRVPEALRPLLTAGTPQTVLPMVQHQMNCLRTWAQLAWVAQTGQSASRQASIRGEAADRAAFIAAMHSVSGPVADDLVARLGPPKFKHLLDVGGASGTWTLAFLRAVPDSTATIFDLPDAIRQAHERLNTSGLVERIGLASGDFYQDELPPGADLAWVSAIAHQHSRQHNRELYAKVYRALEPGGQIMVRDFVMKPDRVQPADGALFAINMLVNTETGGTFTFEEFAEDLGAAGFAGPEAVLWDDTMLSVVAARKP